MWVLLWIGLVLTSLVVFAFVGRSLWRKAVALGNELAVAAERFGAISEQLETLAQHTAEPTPLAVFADPAELRRRRVVAAKSARRRRERHTSR